MSDDTRTPAPPAVAPVRQSVAPVRITEAADATREVRRVLDAGAVGRGDYEITSRKENDAAVTTVTISGWGPPSLAKFVGVALRRVSGASVKRASRTFTITFS